MAQGSLVTNYIFVPTISLISIYQTFCFTQLDMWEMNLLPHIKCHKVAHELSFCVTNKRKVLSKMFQDVYMKLHICNMCELCRRMFSVR